MATTDEKEAAILGICKRIPTGSVATYGQIARLAGFPGNARLVGTILKKLPANSGVPWHRVVNSQGKIAERGKSRKTEVGGYEAFQRELLELEGVCLDGAGRVPLGDYQWDAV